MDSEYSLKISLTEHRHDHTDAPYYWCISKYDDGWHIIKTGWEKTPDLCFLSAMKWIQGQCPLSSTSTAP